MNATGMTTHCSFSSGLRSAASPFCVYGSLLTGTSRGRMFDRCSFEEEVGCELCHRGRCRRREDSASVASLTSCSKDRGRLRLPRQTDTLMVLYHSACEEGAIRNSSPVLESLSRLEQCARVKDRTAIWECSQQGQAQLRARRREVKSD